MLCTDIVVAGAGVVGLAVAARLANPALKVVVLDKNPSFGQETSSRSSNVIHAGLYYQEDTLKTRLCVRGRELLYDACRKYDIPHKKPGKLIVASTREEVVQLQTLYRQGISNGAGRLELISEGELKRLEPNVNGVAALLSPETGIIDPMALMRLFLQQARDQGAMVAFQTEVIGLDRVNGNYRVAVKDPSGHFTFETGIFINCCGLHSDKVAAMAGIDPEKAGYRLHYCKGEYFSLVNGKRKLVTRLVYPVPEVDGAGLGVHITPDLEGNLRLGPDASYVSSISYEVDVTRKRAFWQAANLLAPAIALEDIAPDFAGIRPKLQGPREAFRDFVIRHEADRGLPGLVNLVGIESPGLTGSMAIAEYVAGITGSR